MGVDVANGQLDTPRLAASPWPYFAGLVVATWVLDLVWHAQFAAHRGGFAVTVSWLIMTLAMMTPTTVPMLGSLVEVVARREPRTFWLFLVGYLAVWAAFAFAIAQDIQRPVRYVGTGEKMTDLAMFDAPTFVDSLFARDA